MCQCSIRCDDCSSTSPPRRYRNLTKWECKAGKYEAWGAPTRAVCQTSAIIIDGHLGGIQKGTIRAWAMPSPVQSHTINSCLLGTIIGSFLVGYIGTPTSKPTCRIRACYASSVRAYRLRYIVLVILWERALEVALGSLYSVELESNLKMHERIGNIWKHNASIMQKKLTRCQASPHYMRPWGGGPLQPSMQVDRSDPCWFDLVFARSGHDCISLVTGTRNHPGYSPMQELISISQTITA